MGDRGGGDMSTSGRVDNVTLASVSLASYKSGQSTRGGIDRLSVLLSQPLPLILFSCICSV